MHMCVHTGCHIHGIAFYIFLFRFVDSYIQFFVFERIKCYALQCIFWHNRHQDLFSTIHICMYNKSKTTRKKKENKTKKKGKCGSKEHEVSYLESERKYSNKDSLRIDFAGMAKADVNTPNDLLAFFRVQPFR